MSWKSWSYRILGICTSTFILLALTLKNYPPIPSLSLLSLTGTPAAFNISSHGSSTCAVHNLTARFLLSAGNKLPVLYTDFHLSGGQDDFFHSGRSENDFISASTASASVQSLERFGEWRDTITFSVPEVTVYIATWITREKYNETIRTGSSILYVHPTFTARHAAGKKPSFSTNCYCGDSSESSNRIPLLAEVVVSSGNQSPELNFSKSVFGCTCDCPFTWSWVAFFCVIASIVVVMVPEISWNTWRARAEEKVVTNELSRLVSERKYEEAFTSALQRRDVNIVSWLCSQVDMQEILSTVPLVLSHWVLLSLLQQLSYDINNDTSMKLIWMTDVVAAMNPADPMIAMHGSPIFERVYRRLHHQRSVPKMTGPDRTSIRLLMLVINSMLTACK